MIKIFNKVRLFCKVNLRLLRKVIVSFHKIKNLFKVILKMFVITIVKNLKFKMKKLLKI